MAEDPEWRKQYDLLFKILTEENHRYWSRFNISILINGGLIVAFSSLVGFVQKSLGSSIEIIGLFAITIAGIIFSILWYRLTIFANSWSKYYHSKLKDIEKDHIIENLRVFPSKEGVMKGSITALALWHSRIFIGFWCVLFGVLILLRLNLLSI